MVERSRSILGKHNWEQVVDKWREDTNEQTRDAMAFQESIIKSRSLDAAKTSLLKLEKNFLAEQEGRGNTAKTLKYYRGIWKKLYEFLAYEAAGSDNYQNNDLIEEVSKLPIITLRLDNFQNKYRRFMQNICVNNEQTIQSHMRGLRAIMKYIMSNGWLTDAPRINVKDTDSPIKITFTEKELEVLSRKPKADSFIEYRGWIVTRYTMATGNRAGSIASLKVKDIDFEDGYVNVNIVKNKQPIRLPLVNDILKDLREFISFYRTDEDGSPLYDEPLFPNQFGGELNADEIGRLFRTYCRNRGIDKNSIHLLRHTFAKRYITNGGDVLSLKTMLGHKSLKMVNHYARLYGSDIKSLVEKHSLISQTKIKGGRHKIIKR